MARTPFSAAREPLLSASQLERIEEGMVRILTRIGVRVPDGNLRSRIARKGFAVSGDRALIERRVITDYLESERARNGHSYGPAQADPPPGPLTMGVSQYSQNVIDVENGEVRPFTVESLVEATKVVDGLSSRGVVAGAPGTPMDVAADLQPVTLYWISCTYSRHGRDLPDPRSVRSHRFLMDMAECVGNPVALLPVYVVTPLTLAGESLDAVLAFEDRIETAWVLSMPAAGATAPIRLGDAYALAAAEVIGSAILLREIVHLTIGWEIQMFPFDLRQMAMVFGSPENFLMQLATAEVDAYLHGSRWSAGAKNVHTMAKEPGAQAAAEKASLMTTGALLGTRRFVNGGTLSLDEIFSAEQLVIDCEIKDHVEHMIAGLDLDCDLDMLEEEVREGTKRGFIGLDSTLEGYRSACWYPRFFERRLLGPWREAGSPNLRDEARQHVRHLIADFGFALDASVQKELDALHERAKAELGGL